MKPSHLVILVAALGVSLSVRADIADRPDVRIFIRELAERHHFASTALETLFRHVESQGKIIDAMTRPAEAKPWRDYRKIFMTEARIRAGVNFWDAHRAALEQAQAKYGVPPEMIVAILGVETAYGERTGGYRVIDALSTLAFDYPRRAEFFRTELEAYLLLCREEAVDPLQLKGSYAGAMGIPQFMPSSYRRYAADLEHDGKRDIWTNPADAIASVANYFAANGWQQGGAVAFPARVSGSESQTVASTKNLKPRHSLSELRRLGVEPIGDAPASSASVNLLALDGEAGPEYWLTLHNFLVITRYNHSPLYAMAAYQLGREVKARRGG